MYCYFHHYMNGLPVTLIEAQVAGLPVYASDTITKEVNISNNINFVSLKNTPDIWVEEILNNDNSRKNISKVTIQKAGYDDKNETKKLENLYIELIEKGAINGKSITN